MSALDRIDPELVEIVARLRRDPSSFLHQGRAGGSVSRSLQAEVRPASRERANRAAERQLLAKHRDELAVWLLRGASVALRQDPVFSRVYVVEDDSPHRRSWEPAEFRRGALIAMEDVARVPADDLEREVGALRVLVGGSTELRGVLDACVLAERLRPFPSGAYLLGQAMLLAGELIAASDLLDDSLRRTDDPAAREGMSALIGAALLHRDQGKAACESFLKLFESTGKHSYFGSAVYANAEDDNGPQLARLRSIASSMRPEEWARSRLAVQSFAAYLQATKRPGLHDDRLTRLAGLWSTTLQEHLIDGGGDE
jgi:hypothetical protein